MINPLLYRRQFLLARQALPELQGWQGLSIGDLTLHCHPDLPMVAETDGTRTLILLGYLFDARDPEKQNRDILDDLVRSAQSFSEVVLALKAYAGRYALIYHDNSALKVLHDALALREVYYCTRRNQVVCGSQPNLLARFSDPPIGETTNAEIRDFYRNSYRDRKWIGAETYFENVNHLLPNHFLDLQTLQASRYWPSQKIAPISLDEAVGTISAFLQAMLKAVTNRHGVMMAVTAGTDSRTLLAASRAVSGKIYYFINDHNLGENHPDIRIPRQMFRRLGLPFSVHAVPREVDAEFKRLFLSSVFQATELLLPTIYNVYFEQFSNKVNILGIGEIGRTRYGKQPRRLNAFRMAHALGYQDSNYVIHECEKLLPEMLTVARECRVNVLTLLYWEQMLGNWGTVGNSESDIAMEEFDPYDSHFLYETFLGVASKYTKYGNPIVFKQLIRKMWPELLNWPINPPRPGHDRAKSMLKTLGLHGALKEIEYQLGYARYCFSTWIGRGH